MLNTNQRKEGKEKGLKEGKEKGIKEGKEKGLKEGREDEKVNIAKMMKKDGEHVDKIIRFTGLSKVVIERL